LRIPAPDQEAAMNDRDGEWRSQDTPGFREHKGSGAGAVVGGSGEPAPREPESEAQARRGPIADEHMHEGWGGPGEAYAPTQGPTQRENGEQSQDRKFWGKTQGERSRDD
jgi:hypothetical protein